MAVTAAQRAAKKGKKRQERKKKAQLHKLEFYVMNHADRKTAVKVMRAVERRERLNNLANHTRKAEKVKQ